jgi:ribosomal protein uS17
MDQMSNEEKNKPEQEEQDTNSQEGGLLNKITEVADNIVETAADAVESVAETASDVVQTAESAVEQAAEKVGIEIGQDETDDSPEETAPASAPETPAEKEAVLKAAPEVVGTFPEAGEPKSADGRNERKTRDGIVVSNKMDKTIAVTIQRRLQHPIYGKYVKKSKKLIAHDEANECQIGDVVRIMECRPLSRRKRWRLVSVLQKAK